MIGSEQARKEPASIAERSRKHRKRKRNREVQLALAIARLVQGRAQEEQRIILKDYLNKHADRELLDDDQLRTVDEAVDKLSSRFSRL